MLTNMLTLHRDNTQNPKEAMRLNPHTRWSKHYTTMEPQSVLLTSEVFAVCKDFFHGIYAATAVS